VSDKPDGPKEFVAQNVVAVSFHEDSAAYEALTDLKELDTQGQLRIQAAAVVVRDDSGHLAIKDEVGGHRLTATGTGGLLGLLIGVIGGPFGVLLGGATGLLIGSLFDIEDEDDTESVLSDISKAVRPGQTALLAQLTEQSYEIFDAAMAHLNGTVLRRPVADVEAEIAAAEEAQRAAKKEARKVLREQRRAKEQAAIRAKIDELRAKLPHREHAAAADT
jgi:uncharacterized membrane protein